MADYWVRDLYLALFIWSCWVCQRWQHGGQKAWWNTWRVPLLRAMTYYNHDYDDHVYWIIYSIDISARTRWTLDTLPDSYDCMTSIGIAHQVGGNHIAIARGL